MVDLKKLRKNRPTAAEKKGAFKAQAPTGKSKKANVKTPIVMSGVDFGAERKAYSNFDAQEANWIPSENLFGQAFYIKRVWSFEGEFGSKVGFEITFEPNSQDTALFSLTWTEERETYVKTFRAIRRKHSEVCIGPMTLIEVPSRNEANDYRKIVPYSDSLAAEYADRATTPGQRKGAKKAASVRTKAAKINKVKQLAAKKPGRKQANTSGKSEVDI